MALRFRDWRAGHLLASWAAWWVLLTAATLGNAVRTFASFSGAPGTKQSVAAGFSNGSLKLTIMDGAKTAWEGSTSVTALVLWVAGPPLALWVAWLLTRPSRAASAREQALLDSAPPELRPRMRQGDRVDDA